MKCGAIRALLADLLAGAAGGDRQRWFDAVGEIEELPIVSNPRCNWRVNPRGTAREIDAIHRAVEIVKAEHPYCQG